jgi:hypothetical protein
MRPLNLQRVNIYDIMWRVALLLALATYVHACTPVNDRLCGYGVTDDGSPCRLPVFPCAPEVGREACTDGIDNDGDGHADDCGCPHGAPADQCGVCGGDGGSCTHHACGGIPHVVPDACGVCGGDNSTCMGCDGIPASGRVASHCGVCGGRDAECPSCKSPAWDGPGCSQCRAYDDGRIGICIANGLRPSVLSHTFHYTTIQYADAETARSVVDRGTHGGGTATVREWWFPASRDPSASTMRCDCTPLVPVTHCAHPAGPNVAAATLVPCVACAAGWSGPSCNVPLPCGRGGVAALTAVGPVCPADAPCAGSYCACPDGRGGPACSIDLVAAHAWTERAAIRHVPGAVQQHVTPTTPSENAPVQEVDPATVDAPPPSITMIGVVAGAAVAPAAVVFAVFVRTRGGKAKKQIPPPLPPPPPPPHQPVVGEDSHVSVSKSRMHHHASSIVTDVGLGMGAPAILDPTYSYTYCEDGGDEESMDSTPPL